MLGKKKSRPHQNNMLAFTGVVFIENFLNNFVKMDTIHGGFHFSKKLLSIKTSGGNS